MSDTVTTLRTRLASYPAASHPLEHATIRFNIGLALAEDPSADRPTALRQAIVEYAAALGGFDSGRYPRERSRVLTALGAAERDLGLARQARDRFREALSLVNVVDDPAEVGAAANGLGLALVDLGDVAEAIESYALAEEAFAAHHPKQLATVLHNMGQAVARQGEVADLDRAAEIYRSALSLVTPTADGYIWGSLHHALAAALLDIPDQRADRLQEALRAETAALTVFTRRQYPFQHAMAMNNLAVTYEELDPSDVTMLRRALFAIEAAVTVFDPRLHPQPSQEARRNLARIEKRLAGAVGRAIDRAEHFVLLTTVVSRPERTELLRSRLGMIFDQPQVDRTRSLMVIDRVIVGLPEREQTDLTRAWLAVLMERPRHDLQAGLASRLDVHRGLGPTELSVATRALEAALGDLEILQRVTVRDALVGMGYSRPEGS